MADSEPNTAGLATHSSLVIETSGSSTSTNGEIAPALNPDLKQGLNSTATNNLFTSPQNPISPLRPWLSPLTTLAAILPAVMRRDRSTALSVGGSTSQSSGVMGGPGGTLGNSSSGPDFDGLLVGWDPRVSAAERAEARRALNLNLREEIKTAAMYGAGAGGLDWIDLPPGLSGDQAIEILSKQPGVRFAEKNWRLNAQASSNDPYVTNGSLWGMYGDSSSPANAFGSQAAEAWSAGYTGSSNVYVGIIDEGYQYTHPDLAANAGTNPGEISGDKIDNDGNGYVDDVYGWDFIGGNNTVYDGAADDHGTHVAGTIGARGGNGAGVAGVNWDVKMLSGKFLGANGGSLADAIKAIDYFTDLKNRGLNIVATNNSWSGGGYSQGLYDAIERANKANILFIAAAGNAGSNIDITPSYPASYSNSNVIAVAAITSSGARSSFSNYGATSVDLGAPGSGIWSTVPDNGYASYEGTSMATPHVTGAAALLSSAYPNATAAQIKQALLEGAAPTTSLSGLTVTGRRLDIPSALTRLGQLVASSDPSAPTYTVAAPSSVNEGSPLAITINTTNVAPGTTLYWKFSGTGISTTDFSGSGPAEGSVTLDASGKASLSTTLAADLTTEGNENLLYEFFSDPTLTSRVASRTVIINDTSRPAGVTLWGTTANDSLSGGGGPDRITGVQSSGTTAADMGAGQVDTLTGQADADVFVLGDSRGVFYDDRSSGNIGSSDYALITDFVTGVDKLQMRAGTKYIYTTSSSGLNLYWDRNGNGQLNSSGSNRDELIAVLRGVTALAGTDLISV